MGTIDSLVGRAVVLVITVLGVIALLPGVAHPKTITEIIDSTGDGGDRREGPLSASHLSPGAHSHRLGISNRQISGES